jgi:hypothetical protein
MVPILSKNKLLLFLLLLLLLEFVASVEAAAAEVVGVLVIVVVAMELSSVALFKKARVFPEMVLNDKGGVVVIALFAAAVVTARYDDNQMLPPLPDRTVRVVDMATTATAVTVDVDDCAR